MADDITLQIRDQMTAPLKNIKGALDAARLATKGLDTQVHNLDKSQGNWAKAGKKLLGEFAPKIKETGANMSEMGVAAGLASGGAMLAVKGVKELASAAKELALSLVDATLKLIEFTAASARMREKNVANFSLMRGNAKLGRETYDMLGNIAARQHASQEQVFDYGKELLQAGIKPQRQLARLREVSRCAVEARDRCASVEAQERAYQSWRGPGIPVRRMVPVHNLRR